MCRNGEEVILIIEQLFRNLFSPREPRRKALII